MHSKAVACYPQEKIINEWAQFNHLDEVTKRFLYNKKRNCPETDIIVSKADILV